MITRKQKEEIVSGLSGKLKKASFVAFVNFNKLPVFLASKLRKDLHAVGAEYEVSKKTLMGVAAKASGLNLDLKKLIGEVAMIFSDSDVVQVAKVITKFAKKNAEMLKVLGGIFEKQWVETSQVVRLASIPPREVLLAQLLQALQGPARNLVGVLSAPMRQLVRVLSEIQKKK